MGKKKKVVEETVEETIEEPVVETVEEPIVEEEIKPVVLNKKYRGEVIIEVEDTKINEVPYKNLYNACGVCYTLSLSQYEEEVK